VIGTQAYKNKFHTKFIYIYVHINIQIIHPRPYNNAVWVIAYHVYGFLRCNRRHKICISTVHSKHL